MEVCPKGMKSNGKIYFRTVAYEGGGRTSESPPPLGPEKTKNGGKCAFFMKRVQIFGCTDIKSGEQTLFRGCLLGKNRKKKFLAFGEPPPPFRVSRTPLFQEVVW